MENKPSPISEIAWVFLKLGTTSFGGPAAHIAMMEEEVVTRREWVSREKFLDLLGATNLIPGPNSTELAIHLGHIRGGWTGLWVAGVCFIAPAMCIVMILAWIYVNYGGLPQVEGVFIGIKPVIIAIIVQALWNLSKSAIKGREQFFVFLFSLALAIFRANEILLLLLSGVVLVLNRQARSAMTYLVSLLGGASLVSTQTVPFLESAFQVTRVPFSLSNMFLFFSKVGSVLYGSGYVLLAFLRNGLVEQRGWLTETQLIDAVAIGQFTPGPVFTTATFLGFLLQGTLGAFVATLGIFLPAFIFVALSAPLIPKIRNSKITSHFLDGVNLASLALMVKVSWELGIPTIINPLSIALFLLSLVALLRFKINSSRLLAVGALVGFLKVYYFT